MTPLRERLGPMALISHSTNPAGLVGRLAEPQGTADGVVYALDGAPSALPGVGEQVHCWSDEAGGWTTTVREVRDGQLVLDRPAWLVRQQTRRSPRVEAAVAVRVQVRDQDVAGRLVDVSAEGAALLIEGTLAPMAGAEVQIALPRGDRVRAVVRSRRTHAHRLLRVVGLQWLDVDQRARDWLDRELHRALGQRRRGRGGA
ncbi:hypothetical protein GCM10027446_10610 [Angustibacter peucedani]